MEFNTIRLKQIAELMASEMLEKLSGGAQVAEIEQGLRELSKEAGGLGLQKVIEANEEKYASNVVCDSGGEAKPNATLVPMREWVRSSDQQLWAKDSSRRSKRSVRMFVPN